MSIGANYRSACRAKSRADFVAKIRIVEEEADETQYWLEMLSEPRLINADRFKALNQEANELISIFVSSAKKARQNADKSNH